MAEVQEENAEEPLQLSADQLAEVISTSARVGMNVFRTLFADPEAGVLVTRGEDSEGATYNFEAVEPQPLEPEEVNPPVFDVEAFRAQLELRRERLVEQSERHDERWRAYGNLSACQARERAMATARGIRWALDMLERAVPAPAPEPVHGPRKDTCPVCNPGLR